MDKDQGATKVGQQGRFKQFPKVEGKEIKETLSKESGSTLEEWIGQSASWAPASCQAPMEDKYGNLDNTTKYTDRRPMVQYIYEALNLVVQKCTV